VIDDVTVLKAEMFKALGHPLRLKIVEFLLKGEHAVGEIVEHVGAGQSNTSRHLALLKRAGILGDHKEGLNVYYRVEMPCIANFFVCVQDAVRDKLTASRALLKRIR